MNKNVYIFVSMIVSMLLFQNCGVQTLDSTKGSTGPTVLGLPGPPVVGLPVAEPSGLEQSYLADGEDASIYKLKVRDIDGKLEVFVPSDILSTIDSQDHNDINWAFKHAAGGEVAIELQGAYIDLNDLDVDLDLFLNGILKAISPDGEELALYYLVRENDTEVPSFIQSLIVNVSVAPEVTGLTVGPEVLGEPIPEVMGLTVGPEVLGEPIPEVMGLTVGPEVLGEPIPEVMGKPYSEK